MTKLNTLIKAATFGATLFVSQTVLPATAAPSRDQPAAEATTTLDRSGTLYIEYKGDIVGGMAKYIENKFRQYGEASHKVVLGIHSGGGSVEAGEQVIHVLKRIKKTHRLVTAVLPGKTCASMCVPIYLQGNDRYAARSSLWLFHDAAKRMRNGSVALDRDETMRIYRRYFVPAGVSVDWLNAVLRSTNRADLWQTGQDLIEAKTGIVTHIIANKQGRRVAGETRPAARQATGTDLLRSAGSSELDNSAGGRHDRRLSRVLRVTSCALPSSVGSGQSGRLGLGHSTRSAHSIGLEQHSSSKLVWLSRSSLPHFGWLDELRDLDTGLAPDIAGLGAERLAPCCCCDGWAVLRQRRRRGRTSPTGQVRLARR